jgi:hypothetical protein
MLFASSIDGSFGDFLQQGVGLAVDDLVAPPDDRVSNGLGDMTLAGTGWA